MPHPEREEDTTKIRVPSKSAKKIPDRYSASLVIIEGHAEGMEYPLKKAYTVIGRDKAADIPVKDPLVSRQHAAVLFTDDEFFLKDLESTNGTLFKGAVIEQTLIKHKDKFQVGETTLQFILEDTGGGKVYEIQDRDG